MTSEATNANETKIEDRTFEEESLILEATEMIEMLLERKDISRADLARSLGKSRAYVSQVMSGDRNMTLRTLAHLAYELGFRVRVEEESLATKWVPKSGKAAEPRLIHSAPTRDHGDHVTRFGKKACIQTPYGASSQVRAIPESYTVAA